MTHNGFQISVFVTSRYATSQNISVTVYFENISVTVYFESLSLNFLVCHRHSTFRKYPVSHSIFLSLAVTEHLESLSLHLSVFCCQGTFRKVP